MIRAIDISPSYGGGRDIAVATADAALAGNVSNIYVVKSTGFGGWLAQLPVARPVFIDFEDIKFSPSYGSDASLSVVFSDNLATWYNIALRDLARNTTTGWSVGTGPLAVAPDNGTEIRDPSWGVGTSPDRTRLNNACLQLPSDFSGQAASLRRAYISLDAFPFSDNLTRTGIFRIDDTTQYTLMDTTNTVNKSIYSIAYFGTYASGKLLAGERMGFPCTATVPTWFTDSPTTCPVPCWYPALKPTTGAANQAACAITQAGVGGAIVGWRADGALAYVVTGSLAALPTQTFAFAATPWYANWLLAPIPRDESAFAISRNNGETWNQLGLIDTGAVGQLSRLVDVAPTPDCKTVYLASVNTVNGLGCDEFDSVWRSSSNSEVVAPLPAVPVGIYWERILCHVTAPNCNNVLLQTDLAILRLVPYCADPSGQIVAWAVYDTAMNWTPGIALWSPDYGDYWATVTPRDPVQDFCFESATVMYFLSPQGVVQKMPYTGTAWSNTLESVTSSLPQGHTIAAYPEGKVLVGTTQVIHTLLYAASYSGNFNTDSPKFSVLSLAGRTSFAGNVHVAFDTNFKDNNTIFIADNNAANAGSVYRNTSTGSIRWDDGDMMAATNGATGSLAPHQVGQFGLVIAFTGADGQCALYSAHAPTPLAVPPSINSGVCRTLWPLDGMPKPGIVWDCLIAGIPPAKVIPVFFTCEPSSLKLCGCCTIDTDTTLYALDNHLYAPAPGQNGVGMLWAFTDCMAKKGPALITEDKALIGCDPVSGRSQEVNLCWEQLCIADAYDIEIAKKDDFAIRIIDWVIEGTATGAPPPGFLTWPPAFLTPADVTIPCAFFPAGGLAAFISGSEIAQWGNLECGHTYYWRIQVRECATTQIVRSPWSEVRSFTVKAGLPVSTPYYGVQLLSPNNGGLGIPVKPVSFSWSPFKETTKYKFVLATDAAMTQVVKEADVTTTAFEYDGTLEYSSNYFWRVMSVEPAPSDWSATFSFLTEAAPAVEKGPPAAPPTPVWVWVVIALGAILVIVTLVLIFKTRRV
jgi:hypothetical protein